MYYLVKAVATPPSELWGMILLYAPWLLLVLFLVTQARPALTRRFTWTNPPPGPTHPTEPPAEPLAMPPKNTDETTELTPADSDPNKVEDAKDPPHPSKAEEPKDPPLPPPSSPPASLPTPCLADPRQNQCPD